MIWTKVKHLLTTSCYPRDPHLPASFFYQRDIYEIYFRTPLNLDWSVLQCNHTHRWRAVNRQASSNGRLWSRGTDERSGDKSSQIVVRPPGSHKGSGNWIARSDHWIDSFMQKFQRSVRAYIVVFSHYTRYSADEQVKGIKQNGGNFRKIRDARDYGRKHTLIESMWLRQSTCVWMRADDLLYIILTGNNVRVFFLEIAEKQQRLYRARLFFCINTHSNYPVSVLLSSTTKLVLHCWTILRLLCALGSSLK